MNEGCDIYYAQFGAYYRRGEIIMCDKIEELEKKIEDLEKTNGRLRELIEKKNTKIQELFDDYDELNDSYVELTQDHDELKKENESLKKQLANALDLYDERGEVIEEYEDLKAAIRTITAIMSKVGGIK